SLPEKNPHANKQRNKPSEWVEDLRPLQSSFMSNVLCFRSDRAIPGHRSEILSPAPPDPPTGGAFLFPITHIKAAISRLLLRCNICGHRSSAAVKVIRGSAIDI